MPSTQTRQNVIGPAKRVVVKVGTASITDASGRLDGKVIAALAAELGEALSAGRQVVLVSSGAIAAGMDEMDLPQRPTTLPMLQAVAAVGQGQLMRAFHDAFAKRGVTVAQVLVTRDDFENRTRYLNIRNTLTTLLDCGVLPILNENDAVAVDEIRFGDNDIIAAHVTNLLAADVLVLLSGVDGVLRDGKPLDVVQKVDQDLLSLADGKSRLGSGGMASKMTAAGLVTRAGGAAVIANARASRILNRLLSGEKVGTVFVPSSRKLSGRRLWIGQASRPAGKIHVDAGAARALTAGGKSLLPSGITAVTGRFAKGATVTIVGPDGAELARGLTNYSAEQIDQIKGLKTTQIARVLGDKPYDEVVHRDNMTVA